jgi:hypothetical protein
VSEREQCASVQREWIGIVSWVACSDRTAILRALIVQAASCLAGKGARGEHGGGIGRSSAMRSGWPPVCSAGYVAALSLGRRLACCKSLLLLLLLLWFAALVCCSGLLLMALLPSALCVCSADGAELLPGGIGATLL